MSYFLISLLCLALALDLLRSAFFFAGGCYPHGYRLREAMWRTFALWGGGGVGWLVSLIDTSDRIPFDFALLMLVGVKMIWMGLANRPFDTDSRFSPGSAMQAASSVNSFLAGLALGLGNHHFWFGAILLGLFSLVMQTVSRGLVRGNVHEKSAFRPGVAGGVIIIVVTLLHFFIS